MLYRFVMVVCCVGCASFAIVTHASGFDAELHFNRESYPSGSASYKTVVIYGTMFNVFVPFRTAWLMSLETANTDLPC